MIAKAMGALMTGQNMNDPKDMDAVTAAFKSLKPNIKMPWSSEDQCTKSFAVNGFDVSMFWSDAVRQKRNAKLPVEFVVPCEGAIVWVDGLTVTAGAPNPEGADAFINWIIDPKFYLEWATKVGAPASSNSGALAALPADDLSSLVPKPANMKSAHVMSAMSDDRRAAFNNAWSEVKAFYVE